MNTEHILDAIGLLDDDLIREAEERSEEHTSEHQSQQFTSRMPSYA